MRGRIGRREPWGASPGCARGPTRGHATRAPPRRSIAASNVPFACYRWIVLAPRRSRLIGVLVLVALSTPLALLVETGVRRLMMPPAFEQVRTWLSPALAPWAWATVPITLVATGLGWWLYGVLLRRALRRAAPEQPAHDGARLEALILASSAPQLPAVGATVLFMLGAPLLPVIVAMGVATLGVLSLGWRLGRGAGNDERGDDAGASSARPASSRLKG